MQKNVLQTPNVILEREGRKGFNNSITFFMSLLSSVGRGESRMYKFGPTHFKMSISI